MADEREAGQFFESLAGDLDTAAPLRWGFYLSGVAADRVAPLTRVVEQMGFGEVEALPDEDSEGQMTLWFAEVQVHTAGSFAERLAAVRAVADREGLVVSDYMADNAGLDEGEDAPEPASPTRRRPWWRFW